MGPSQKPSKKRALMPKAVSTPKRFKGTVGDLSNIVTGFREYTELTLLSEDGPAKQEGLKKRLRLSNLKMLRIHGGGALSWFIANTYTPSALQALDVCFDNEAVGSLEGRRFILSKVRVLRITGNDALSWFIDNLSWITLPKALERLEIRICPEMNYGERDPVVALLLLLRLDKLVSLDVTVPTPLPVSELLTRMIDQLTSLKHLGISTSGMPSFNHLDETHTIMSGLMDSLVGLPELHTLHIHGSLGLAEDPHPLESMPWIPRKFRQCVVDDFVQEALYQRVVTDPSVNPSTVRALAMTIVNSVETVAVENDLEVLISRLCDCFCTNDPAPLILHVIMRVACMLVNRSEPLDGAIVKSISYAIEHKVKMHEPDGVGVMHRTIYSVLVSSNLIKVCNLVKHFPDIARPLFEVAKQVLLSGDKAPLILLSIVVKSLRYNNHGKALLMQAMHPWTEVELTVRLSEVPGNHQVPHGGVWTNLVLLLLNGSTTVDELVQTMGVPRDKLSTECSGIMCRILKAGKPLPENMVAFILEELPSWEKFAETLTMLLSHSCEIVGAILSCPPTHPIWDGIQIHLLGQLTVDELQVPREVLSKALFYRLSAVMEDHYDKLPENMVAFLLEELTDRSEYYGCKFYDVMSLIMSSNHGPQIRDAIYADDATAGVLDQKLA